MLDPLFPDKGASQSPKLVQLLLHKHLASQVQSACKGARLASLDQNISLSGYHIALFGPFECIVTF